MLIMSTERLVPLSTNTLVLEDSQGRYYYVHRSLYDQAVILSDTYTDNMQMLYSLLGAVNPPQVCKTFYEEAPSPINVLGAYLVFVDDADQLEDMEVMCGALSVMAMTMNFRRIPQVKAELRQSVKFSLRIREEYKMHWDRFFAEAPRLDQVSFGWGEQPAQQAMSTYSQPAAASPTSYGQQKSTADMFAGIPDEPVVAEPEEKPDGTDAILKMLYPDLPDNWEEMMEEEEVDGAAGGASTPVAKPEPEPEPEPAQPAAKSGFGLLAGM